MKRRTRVTLVALVVAFLAIATFAMVMATRAPGKSPPVGSPPGKLTSDKPAGEQFVGYWWVYAPDTRAYYIIRIYRSGAGFAIEIPMMDVPMSGLYALEGGKLVPTSTMGTAVFSRVGDDVVMTVPGAPAAVETITPTAPPTPDTSEAIAQGVHAIQQAVRVWADYHGHLFPAAATVVPGGEFARYLQTSWPTNPVTGRPMTSGSGPGDYDYEQLDGGQAFTLTGHDMDGSDMIVP